MLKETSNDALRRFLLLEFRLLDINDILGFIDKNASINLRETSVNSSALELFKSFNLVLKLLVLFLELVDLLLVLNTGIILSLRSTVAIHHLTRFSSSVGESHVFLKKLLNLKLLDFLSEGSLIILNRCFFLNQSLDLIISILHKVLLDFYFSLKIDDYIIITDLIHQIISKSLDFILQLDVLFFLLRDIFLQFLDGRIAKESLLESLSASESVAWSWRIRSWVKLEASLGHSLLGSNVTSSYWLLSEFSLVNQVEWDDSLPDHLCFHQNILVVTSVEFLDCLSDLVQVPVSWVSSVGSLKFVNPLDVITLELVSIGFECLESLNIDWSVKIKILTSFSSDQFLLFEMLEGSFIILRVEIHFTFGTGSIKFSMKLAELILRCVLAGSHLLDKGFLRDDNIIGLLLMLFDDIGIVSLTLNLEFLIFFSEVEGVLFVLGNFLVVSHFDFLKVLHHWFFRDVVGGSCLATLVLGGVLGLEYGTALAWVHNFLHVFQSITEVLFLSHR